MQSTVTDARLFSQRKLDGLVVSKEMIHQTPYLFVPFHDVSVIHNLLEVFFILFPLLFDNFLSFELTGHGWKQGKFQRERLLSGFQLVGLYTVVQISDLFDGLIGLPLMSPRSSLHLDEYLEIAVVLDQSRDTQREVDRIRIKLIFKFRILSDLLDHVAPFVVHVDRNTEKLQHKHLVVFPTRK